MIDPAQIIEDLKYQAKHQHPYFHRQLISKLTPADFKLIVEEVNCNEESRSNWNDSQPFELYNIEQEETAGREALQE